MRYFKTFFIVSLFFLNNYTFGQKNLDYSYLIDCLNNSAKENGERNIDGIGEVKEFSLNSNELHETGLLYFNIPKNKKSKSLLKLAQSVSNDYTTTWKNNSKIIINKEYETPYACIIDLRLHIKIENIYMQVIIINDGEKIYQIMCFRDTNDEEYFNSLVEKTRNHNCL